MSMRHVADAKRRRWDELYDLIADPGEHTNLWDDPAYAATKLDLLLRLNHCQAATVDPLPERIAPW